MAGLGAGNRTEQTWRGYSWIERNRESGAGKAGGRYGADEVIVVTDTFEHADRLQSYQRVAGVAATLVELGTLTVNM